VFWLLLGVLVALCLLVLGLTLFTLWRRVKALSRSAAELGATTGEATAALSALAAPERAAPPCPTCGAPAAAATRTPAARRVRA
jgi:hypothetical protein